MDYDKLKNIVERLNNLLESPEPGLFSYNLMLGQLMNELIKYWESES